jgi:hypothetical protein
MENISKHGGLDIDGKTIELWLGEFPANHV